MTIPGVGQPPPVAASLVVVCGVISQLQSLRWVWRSIEAGPSFRLSYRLCLVSRLEPHSSHTSTHHSGGFRYLGRPSDLAKLVAQQMPFGLAIRYPDTVPIPPWRSRRMMDL